MRFAMVVDEGSPFLAIVKDGNFARLDWLDGLSGPKDLSELIASGSTGLKQAAAAAGALPPSAWSPLSEARFALPISKPGKVICLGLNYADHAKEGGYAVPEYPAIFLRCTTSLLAAGEPIIRPRVSERLDYEAELMAVISRRCRHVSEAEALDYVFGYTCFNDVSVRDYQRKTHQWTPGKNFDKTGPVGPVVVTADELPLGASGLRIQCRLNGQTVQSANTSDMIIPVAKTISLLSEFTTLEPGDLLALGTPQGVGHARTPPLWMKAGDNVEIDIERIAILSNPIVNEAEADGVGFPK